MGEGHIRLVAVAAAIVMLAGGAAARDRQLGAAVQANIAAQAVDLHPVHAGVPIEGGNGERAEGAITRYRNGRVTPLRSISAESQVGANANQRGADAGPGTAQVPR